VREAALSACEADVGKVCLCVQGVQPSWPSGAFTRQRRAAGKAGSEEDGVQDGTEPVCKGGHESQRTRPRATQQERRQLRATGSCEGERSGAEAPTPRQAKEEMFVFLYMKYTKLNVMMYDEMTMRRLQEIE
jgi:hypothetical protein